MPPLRVADLRLGHAENLRGDGGVDVAVLGEGAGQLVVGAEVGEQPQLDLRVVGGQQRPPLGRAGTPGGSAGPARVRAGMFCKFGSLELSRPVAATVWLNDVWTRPVSGFTSAGRAST